MAHIILVGRAFRPESSAAGIQLGVLYDSFIEAGHQVTVLTTRPYPKKVKSEGSIRRWPVLRDKMGAVRGYVQYASFDIPLFFRLLFVRKADAIIVQPPPTTGFVSRIAASLRRTPYFYYADDLLTQATEGAGMSRTVVRIVRVLERFSLRGSATVITISEDVRDEIVKIAGNNFPIENVGTGIDTEVFSLTGDLGNQTGRYFLYSGTFNELHGAEVFIDAFAYVSPEFPDVRVLFYGQGTELDLLKSKVDVLRLPVEFHNPVSPDEIAALMRGAVAGLASIQPDKGYDFAFTTKAFAMMSTGLPVIYSGVGPVRQMVADNALGHTADWDVPEVTQLMRGVLMQPYTDDDRSRISHWVAQNYSMQDATKKVVAIIESKLVN